MAVNFILINESVKVLRRMPDEGQGINKRNKKSNYLEEQQILSA